MTTPQRTAHRPAGPARQRLMAERRRGAAVRRRRVATAQRAARSTAAGLVVVLGALGVVHTLDGVGGGTTGVAHQAAVSHR